MKIFLFLLLLQLPLFAQEAADVHARRIAAHLCIGDTAAAIEEAKEGIAAHPESILLHEFLIKSLARAGNEDALLRVWEEFAQKFPDEAYEKELLEEICWGIVTKGAASSSVSLRLFALLAAAVTQEIRAVKILRMFLCDSNSFVRSVAVELASLYGDEPLKNVIFDLFHKERVWEVREQLFQAIGKLKMTDLLPALTEVVAASSTTPAEKRSAIQAIVSLRESVGREELNALVHSSRASLRTLACACVEECELNDDVDLIAPLIDDPQSEVRVAALSAMGLLRVSSIQDKPIAEFLHSAAHASNPLVSLTAGWVWMLNEKEQGEKIIARWLAHENPETQILAAAALSASGPYGINLARSLLKTHPNPYVKANLAIALLSQRIDVEESLEILAQFLRVSQDKWMWDKESHPLFTPLKKSTLSHHPVIPNYPEAINQTVRLEILNLLALMGYPKALESVKLFLKEKWWGITGIAAQTLLGEGDESAILLVKQLLTDADPHVRVNAALALAVWGKDEAALTTLMEAYPAADRSLKIKILEALGRLGDPQAIDFLIERLKEPHQTLRVISASMLIQTLNH